MKLFNLSIVARLLATEIKEAIALENVFEMSFDSLVSNLTITISITKNGHEFMYDIKVINQDTEQHVCGWNGCANTVSEIKDKLLVLIKAWNDNNPTIEQAVTDCPFTKKITQDSLTGTTDQITGCEFNKGIFTFEQPNDHELTVIVENRPQSGHEYTVFLRLFQNGRYVDESCAECDSVEEIIKAIYAFINPTDPDGTKQDAEEPTKQPTEDAQEEGVSVGSVIIIEGTRFTVESFKGDVFTLRTNRGTGGIIRRGKNDLARKIKSGYYTIEQQENKAVIYEVLDEESAVIGYGVELHGKCSDEYAIDRDEDFETDVDAHAFAEECHISCGARIEWNCTPPAWVNPSELEEPTKQPLPVEKLSEEEYKAIADQLPECPLQMSEMLTSKFGYCDFEALRFKFHVQAEREAEEKQPEQNDKPFLHWEDLEEGTILNNKNGDFHLGKIDSELTDLKPAYKNQKPEQWDTKALVKSIIDGETKIKLLVSRYGNICTSIMKKGELYQVIAENNRTHEDLADQMHSLESARELTKMDQRVLMLISDTLYPEPTKQPTEEKLNNLDSSDPLMKDNTAVIYRGDVLGILYLSGDYPMLEVLRGNQITVKNDEIISYPKREDLQAATREDFKTHKIHCSSSYVIYQPEPTKQPFYMVTPQVDNRVLIKPLKFNDFRGLEQSFVYNALSNFVISEDNEHYIVCGVSVDKVTTALDNHRPLRTSQTHIDEIKENIERLKKTIANPCWQESYIKNCKNALLGYERDLAFLEMYCAPLTTGEL